MSVRASEAYDRGEAPISKWTKSAIVEGIASAYGEEVASKAARYPLALLKIEFLYCTGWHHVGKYAQCVDFYEIDESKDEEELKEAFESLDDSMKRRAR